MSFNRRGGPDRRNDRPDRDRADRAPRRGGPGGGDWQSRDRAGGDRPAYPPRERPGGDRPAYPPRERPSGDRPAYQPRGGGDRPFTPRPQFDRAPDEGAMSIRLDPRRVSTLKQLAGDAGVRPGDLVRQWVEERIDAVRQGLPAPAAAGDLASRLAEITARVAALEAAAGIGPSTAGADVAPATPDDEAEAAPPEAAGDELGDPAAVTAADPDAGDAAEDAVEAAEDGAGKPGPDAVGPKPRRPVKRVAGVPSVDRVALHDEMIAVLSERGPMSAGELAAAISERGRYTPPRSGRTLDAAMVSQRVSNPTYRSRFTRNEGRIGLAEAGSQTAE